MNPTAFVKAFLDGRLQSQGGQAASQQPLHSSPVTEQALAGARWYRRGWFHVLLLVFFPYVQVPLMWFQKKFSFPTRVVISVIGIFLTIAYLSSNQSGPNGSASSTTAPGTGANPTDTIHNGIVRLEFEWSQPKGAYNGYDETNFTAPNYEMRLHGEEVAKGIYDTANKYNDVNRIEIGITITFRAWSYKDKYGKAHDIPVEKIHTGDITIIPDIADIRKYTKRAYVDANSESLASRLLPLVNDRNRQIHPDD